MPPKKLPSRTNQAKATNSSNSPAATKSKPSKPAPQNNDQPAVSEQEVKQSSSVSAQLALQAAKQAYELRQAAYGAGDPNAREEILAKAINKEIEAESFGKAAKYTRSGAFQGLAAGAGIGIQPGATLGKVTGALVGGVVSSVGAVLGGGIGSAYGAMSGPFWDLGQIASQGVRSIVGDFPNWEATSSQKKALEKMVLGAQKTPKPSQDELEEMKEDDGGVSQADFQQFSSDLTSWIPSMPSMPKMPNMPSIPGFGGQSKANQQAPLASKKVSKEVQKPTASSQSRTTNNSQDSGKAQSSTQSKTQNNVSKSSSQPSNPPASQSAETKKRPKKLETRSTTSTSQESQTPVRRAPPKLGPRKKPVSGSG